MKFWKMNGAGNEFVIFDRRSEAPPLTEDSIRAIADPVTGAGADQVIAIERSLGADAFMRIWNRDGSSAEACGNATRCVAHLLMEETGKPGLVIETVAGRLKAERAGELVSVDMGSPLLKWEEIPLAERMDTRGIDLKVGPIDQPYLQLPGAVNMGNPHIVFFVPDLDAVDVKAVGSLVEWHPLFPQGVNVGFLQVLSRNEARLRTWERNAGLTLACGSNNCAAVVAAARRNLTDRDVLVHNDGGDIRILWDEATDRVIMTGPVELEYVAEV
ncbi:MAG: diaminopimelate epimerase [Hyphomonadaceae bacterium]